MRAQRRPTSALRAIPYRTRSVRSLPVLERPGQLQRSRMRSDRAVCTDSGRRGPRTINKRVHQQRRWFVCRIVCVGRNLNLIIVSDVHVRIGSGRHPNRHYSDCNAFHRPRNWPRSARLGRRTGHAGQRWCCGRARPARHSGRPRPSRTGTGHCVLQSAAGRSAGRSREGTDISARPVPVSAGSGRTGGTARTDRTGWPDGTAGIPGCARRAGRTGTGWRPGPDGLARTAGHGW